MSLLDIANETEIFEPEIESSFGQDDVKKKFRLYRSNAEKFSSKYREAKSVIDRLQEEIKLSHELEKSQKIRISLLQNQLSALQEKGIKIHDISEKQRINSEENTRLGRNIVELTNLIQELKEKFQSVINSTVKEIKTIKQSRDLKCLVSVKEAELNELKIELKSSLSEKEEQIKRYAVENEQLKREIEISKSVMNDMKKQHEKITDSYKQQILEYERVVEEMERERRSILGDYDVGSILQNESSSPKAVTNHNDNSVEQDVAYFTIEKDEGMEVLVDASVPLRKNKHHPLGDIQNSVDGWSQSKLSPQNSHVTNHDYKVESDISKLGLKQIPKLDFLDPNNELSTVRQPTKPKKRLYSQTSNFFIN